MAIRVRRGKLDKFDPEKLLPGEWAVSIDSETTKQVVCMCFAPGVTKRMGTYEDFKQQIADITEEIKADYLTEFQEILNQIEPLVETSSSNTNTVLQIKSDIEELYLPQMLEYLSGAEESLKTATEKAIISEEKASFSEQCAVLAESYMHGETGIRENEAYDNAKYYYEQAKQISQGMNGLIPMGTISFSELSLENNQVAKYMFNIADDFISDDTFKEGAGVSFPAGTNVYRTEDGYWDCLAGSFQTPNGDAQDNTVTFVSNDTKEPVSYSDVELLTTGEKLSSLFGKVSTMFKNVRFLFGVLGSTDISNVGDGTCTGAINTLNIDLANYSNKFDKIQSHIGMIIHSTTLDTMGKVIDIYGGTEWTKIEGQFLLGQSSSHPVNSTGGSELNSYTPAGTNKNGAVSNTTLTVAQIPAHTHGSKTLKGAANLSPMGMVPSTNAWNIVQGITGIFGRALNDAAARGNGQTTADIAVSGYNQLTVDASHEHASVGGNGAHNHGFTQPTFTGTTATINNMPPYKTVYIWERTA